MLLIMAKRIIISVSLSCVLCIPSIRLLSIYNVGYTHRWPLIIRLLSQWPLIILWCMTFMLDVWKENIKRLNAIYQCLSLYVNDLCMLWIDYAYCTYYQLLMYATDVINMRVMLYNNTRYVCYRWLMPFIVYEYFSIHEFDTDIDSSYMST